MKSVLALALFFVMMYCVSAQHKHCIEKSFTVESVLFVPSKHYDDRHNTFYDVDNQRQRLDVIEYEPADKRFSVFSLYNDKKTYIFDHVAQDCEVHPLDGKLEPFCLSGMRIMISTALS